MAMLACSTDLVVATAPCFSTTTLSFERHFRPYVSKLALAKLSSNCFLLLPSNSINKFNKKCQLMLLPED